MKDLDEQVKVTKAYQTIHNDLLDVYKILNNELGPKMNKKNYEALEKLRQVNNVLLELAEISSLTQEDEEMIDDFYENIYPITFDNKGLSLDKETNNQSNDEYETEKMDVNEIYNLFENINQID